MTATIGVFPQTTALAPHLFSVDDYHKMIETGILREGAPVELIEGVVLCRMSKNPPHETACQRVRKRIERLIPGGWDVRPQAPVTLPTSEPEPDVSVARGDDTDYEARHPGPADLGLVVEVADSSLADDKGIMLRMYARAGIVRYWIVNVPDRQIEVYTQPSGPASSAPAYAHVQIFRPGSVVPLVLDGVTLGTIAVDDVLP
jgi:Uma2 family endonuclease